MAETDYEAMWYALWNPIAERNKLLLDGSFDRKAFEKALVETFNVYLLEVYREELRQHYNGIPIEGIDPLVIRIVTLHHWPIADVENLGNRELMIALGEELNHFELPELAARWAYWRLRELSSRKAQELLNPHMSDGLRKQLP